jgi:uncharacterized protein (TIGR02265 family)
LSADAKLIFKPVLEAMYVHGLSDRMTPAFRAKLTSLGINLDKLLPGYAYEVWERSLLEAVQLFPELDAKAALTELGRRMCVATIEHIPGASTLMPMLRVLGITRAIKRALKRGTSENFNQVTFGAETPKSLEVHMSFVGAIPDFAKGTQLGLVPYFGAKEPACSITKVDGQAATFLLTWT